MKPAYLKIDGDDRMRMERIVLDRDAEDALRLVQVLLERIAGMEQSGMRSHLDVRSSE